MKALAWIVGATLLALGLIYTPYGCGNDCQPHDSTNAAGRAFVTGGTDR